MFEVVLTDGRLSVRADSQPNKDLWKGLRGGPNSVGIVTAIDFVTLRQGQLCSALTINPTNVIDQLVKIYANLMAEENYDVKASFLTGWVFSSNAGRSTPSRMGRRTRGSIRMSWTCRPVLKLEALPSSPAWAHSSRTRCL